MKAVSVSEMNAWAASVFGNVNGRRWIALLASWPNVSVTTVHVAPWSMTIRTATSFPSRST